MDHWRPIHRCVLEIVIHPSASDFYQSSSMKRQIDRMCIDVQGLRTCEGFRWLSLGDTLDIFWVGCVALKSAIVRPSSCRGSCRPKKKKERKCNSREEDSIESDRLAPVRVEASKLADVISRTGILSSPLRALSPWVRAGLINHHRAMEYLKGSMTDTHVR